MKCLKLLLMAAILAVGCSAEPSALSFEVNQGNYSAQVEQISDDSYDVRIITPELENYQIITLDRDGVIAQGEYFIDGEGNLNGNIIVAGNGMSGVLFVNFDDQGEVESSLEINVWHCADGTMKTIGCDQ